MISFLHNLPTKSDWLHRLPQFEFCGEKKTFIVAGQAADQQELWLRLERVEERTDSSLLSCLDCPVVTISLAAAGDERSLCEFGKQKNSAELKWVMDENANIIYWLIAEMLYIQMHNLDWTVSCVLNRHQQ